MEELLRVAVLQGGSNPPYSGVITPMSEKSITYGFKPGTIKRPFYTSKNTQGSLLLGKCLLNPNHDLMKGRFQRFPSQVSMLSRKQWHKSQSFVCWVPIYQPLHVLKKE
jgi:hypothetical protein